MTIELLIFLVFFLFREEIVSSVKAKMGFSQFLLKFLMLASVSTCICYAKSYQSNQSYKQQLGNIREREHATRNKNEIVARLNDTDSLALAEVMQKEPKFFDEFECEYHFDGIKKLSPFECHCFVFVAVAEC